MTTDKDSKPAEMQETELDAARGGVQGTMTPSTYMLPEVDDEVLVGFVNDDPRDPVIQGMLHSSAKPAPIKPGK